MKREYIIENVQKLNSGEACLKQPVYAMLVTIDGKEYFGSNEMKACVTICPREELNLPSGEGYHHCKETCKQDYHGEHEAVKRATTDNAKTKDSVMYLVGHHYCCDNCMSVMKKAGVKKVIYVDTKKEEEL